MQIHNVIGDLLEQDVEVIVNAWNQNIIPRWLLRPHGVSGAIKRQAGPEPFRELAQHGPLALGQAVLTGPGNLAYRGIIHAAAITLWGRSSERIVRVCVRNALALAQEQRFASIAFPLLGSGSGGLSARQSLAAMTTELQTSSFEGRVLIVQYRSA